MTPAPAAVPLSIVEIDARNWLEGHGGDGVFSPQTVNWQGELIVMDVVLARGDFAGFHADVWERLITLGVCQRYTAGHGMRIRLVKPAA